MKQFLVVFFFGVQLASAQVSKGATFEVDQVKQNHVPLKTTSLDTILQNRFLKKIIAIPTSSQGKKVAATWQNGLVETVHISFAEHRPLILSPDDIWLAICQGFGNHIAVTSDEMKMNLISERAPEEIRVFIRDLAEGDPNGWETMVNGFNDSLDIYLKENAVSLVNQKFSTTTPVITTAYQITLMDAVKSYFSFAVESGCGIPSVTLLGTTEDWQKIYDQLDRFNAFGLEFWTRELKPVIQEFIDASKGKEHREFWQSIYKHESFYTKSTVTGWIHKFFPYLTQQQLIDGDAMEQRELEFKDTYVRNPYIAGKNYLLSDVGTSDFPKGYVSVPFIWDEFDPETRQITQHKLRLYAGFLGIEQHENLALSPNISWWIVRESSLRLDYIYWNNEGTNISERLEQEYLWKPGIIDSTEAIHLPIFAPYKNPDYHAGIASLRRELNKKGLDSYGASTLKIISTFDGGTIFHSVEGPLSSREAEIKTIIEKSDWLWTPATAKVKPLFSEVRTAPANYLIELKL